MKFLKRHLTSCPWVTEDNSDGVFIAGLTLRLELSGNWSSEAAGFVLKWTESGRFCVTMIHLRQFLFPRLPTDLRAAVSGSF